MVGVVAVGDVGICVDKPFGHVGSGRKEEKEGRVTGGSRACSMSVEVEGRSICSLSLSPLVWVSLAAVMFALSVLCVCKVAVRDFLGSNVGVVMGL